VSSSCDGLLEGVNAHRIADLGLSERLLALELAMKNLNNGEGLGFVMPDESVLDKRRLKRLFTTVGGAFAAIVRLEIVSKLSMTCHAWRRGSAPLHAKFDR
jgi:hypothetical protein